MPDPGSAPDRHDLLAAELADHYLIEEELGRGGSATVYLAQDLRHGRRVALKVLHSALGAALGVERFQREIRTHARLQHPHILPLYDSGSAAGRLYYTMPYVEAGSLRDRLRRSGRLEPPAAVQLALEVASALAYAHRRGIIHRDLKPENIMVSPTGEAILADFGIAYALDQPGDATDPDTPSGPRLTETGVTVGTPIYMSPEQAAGDEELTGRSDQYALAAVIYEALAGNPPFTGANARAILAKKLTTSPRALREVLPHAPDVVDQVLMRALSRYPDERFGGMDGISAALLTADTSFAAELEAVRPASFDGDSARYHLLHAETAGFRGDRAAERAHADSALVVLERLTGQRPDDAKLLARTGVAYARAGRKTEAVRAGRRAAELLPPARDANSDRSCRRDWRRSTCWWTSQPERSKPSSRSSGFPDGSHPQRSAAIPPGHHSVPTRASRSWRAPLDGPPLRLLHWFHAPRDPSKSQ